MKVLMIKPGEHPKTVEIEHTNAAMQKAVDSNIYQATYPWEEPCALVCDEEACWHDYQLPNRMIPELGYPIMGPFFICGLTTESFCDLPEELNQRFTREYWKPEVFIRTGAGILVVPMDDGTRPK